MILSVFSKDNAISSKPSNKHFFLNESISNLISLFPKIIFWLSKLTSISSFLKEYSEICLIYSSSILIGNIPFLKQLL